MLEDVRRSDESGAAPLAGRSSSAFARSLALVSVVLATATVSACAATDELPYERSREVVASIPRELAERQLELAAKRTEENELGFPRGHDPVERAELELGEDGFVLTYHWPGEWFLGKPQEAL